MTERGNVFHKPGIKTFLAKDTLLQMANALMPCKPGRDSGALIPHTHRRFPTKGPDRRAAQSTRVDIRQFLGHGYHQLPVDEQGVFLFLGGDS
jgi:hypothetical protein